MRRNITKKKQVLKDIPSFKSEDEERDFWDTHSVLDFPNRFVRVHMDFSKLKPTAKSITIRLPLGLVEDLKTLANKRDVPYQSLMKIMLAEKVREEFARG